MIGGRGGSMFNIELYRYDYERWRRGEESFATLAPYHFDCPVCGNGLLTYVGGNHARCNYYKCSAVVPVYCLDDLVIPECLRSHSDMPFSGNHGAILMLDKDGRIRIAASSKTIPDCRNARCNTHRHDENETFSGCYWSVG